MARVEVLVWRMSPDNPGHVSMQVGETYMSYWPSGPAGKKDFKIGETHQPSFPSSYRTDCRLERRECDKRVELDDIDADLMVKRWEAFMREPTRYNMLNHNCSTVIATLLEIGTGVPPAFIPKVKIDDHIENELARFLLRIRFLGGHLDMWTPDAVLDYARQLQGGRT